MGHHPVAVAKKYSVTHLLFSLSANVSDFMDVPSDLLSDGKDAIMSERVSTSLPSLRSRSDGLIDHPMPPY